jgi:hypothetical protein
MKISKMRDRSGGWKSFSLNVGGFTIRDCRWNARTRRVVFPLRYGTRGSRREVVYAHGMLVLRLRRLLESGETETPRDRRPCTLRIHELHPSDSRRDWYVFNFTVRGFTILGCRWKPATGSIQLPVTFFGYDTRRLRYRRRPVVCAYGAHINRLRRALEACAPELVRHRLAPEGTSSGPGTEAAVIEGVEAVSGAASSGGPPLNDSEVPASAADSPVLVETHN